MLCNVILHNDVMWCDIKTAAVNEGNQEKNLMWCDVPIELGERWEPSVQHSNMERKMCIELYKGGVYTTDMQNNCA